jgi:nucleotide-binding universal stress UspA family protein
MSYRTILVHVHSGAAAERRIRLAANLARSMDAHLVGSAPSGISRFLPPAAAAAGGPAFAARCEQLRRRAAEALAGFEQLLVQEGVISFESRLVDDDIDAALALQARYCDLVVVGQAGGNAASPTSPASVPPLLPDDLPEYLLLTSGRPVLVVPAAGTLPGPGRDALIAWDGSTEASRAVADALPLLRGARLTTVLGFGNGTALEAASSEDCERLAAYLRRHGVAAHADSRALGDDIGEALLSAAADAGAGLLVMGGYGHAHFRELMLGGVTATILREMTLPVLIAH